MQDWGYTQWGTDTQTNTRGLVKSCSAYCTAVPLLIVISPHGHNSIVHCLISFSSTRNNLRSSRICNTYVGMALSGNVFNLTIQICKRSRVKANFKTELMRLRLKLKRSTAPEHTFLRKKYFWTIGGNKGGTIPLASD